MAKVFKWPATNILGPLVFGDEDDDGTIDALYIYAMGVSDGEMAQLIGYRYKDGSLVDGSFTNYCQALAATSDSIDLNSATLEVDDTPNSPLLGRLRVKFTVVAATSAD